MKKKVLSIATASLFTAGIFLSISENSHGQISLIEKSHAQHEQVSPYIYKEYSALCNDGKTVIYVCGVGNDTCIPLGTCPGM